MRPQIVTAPQATYHEPVVPEYRGNPFIEALPPLLERADAKNLMRYLPEYSEDMRGFPATQREHLASMVAALRQPTWLHGELYSRVSRLICNGYVSRNPVASDFQRIISARQGLLDFGGGSASPQSVRMNGGYLLQPNIMPDANGLTFLGTSGIGKSSAMEMVLGLWPQLILHTEFHGDTFSRVQISWMKLNVPSDGSVLALADCFFLALDEVHAKFGLRSDFQKAYMKSRPTEAMIAPVMALVAQQVGLGILVLDELQDLSPAKSRKFLSFLVQLVNTVGVPVVLVGGLDAFHLVTEQFRQVRRGSSEGDLVVTQSEPGERWENFCRVLWQYQFTTDRIEMSEAHTNALFDLSQGITDLLVIAYKNAQIRAISAGARHLTPSIIRSVRDTLNLAQPALGALRRNSDFVIDKMSDLRVPTGVVSQPFLRGDDEGQDAPRVSVPASSGKTIAAKLKKKAVRTASTPTEASPTTVPSDQQTLFSIVVSGKADGVPPRESLMRAGFGDGELWRKVASLER